MHEGIEVRSDGALLAHGHAHPVRLVDSFAMTLAGTPTAMALLGTSWMTTAFAPIRTLSPTDMPPSSFAPVPMTQLLPTVGCALPDGSSVSLFPKVTELKTLQFSPMTTSDPITMSWPCMTWKYRPILALQDMSLA